MEEFDARDREGTDTIATIIANDDFIVVNDLAIGDESLHAHLHIIAIEGVAGVGVRVSGPISVGAVDDVVRLDNGSTSRGVGHEGAVDRDRGRVLEGRGLTVVDQDRGEDEGGVAVHVRLLDKWG